MSKQKILNMNWLDVQQLKAQLVAQGVCYKGNPIDVIMGPHIMPRALHDKRIKDAKVLVSQWEELLIELLEYPALGKNLLHYTLLRDSGLLQYQENGLPLLLTHRQDWFYSNVGGVSVEGNFGGAAGNWFQHTIGQTLKTRFSLEYDWISPTVAMHYEFLKLWESIGGHENPVIGIIGRAWEVGNSWPGSLQEQHCLAHFWTQLGTPTVVMTLDEAVERAALVDIFYLRPVAQDWLWYIENRPTVIRDFVQNILLNPKKMCTQTPAAILLDDKAHMELLHEMFPGAKVPVTWCLNAYDVKSLSTASIVKPRMSFGAAKTVIGPYAGGLGEYRRKVQETTKGMESQFIVQEFAPSEPIEVPVWNGTRMSLTDDTLVNFAPYFVGFSHCGWLLRVSKRSTSDGVASVNGAGSGLAAVFVSD